MPFRAEHALKIVDRDMEKSPVVLTPEESLEIAKRHEASGKCFTIFCGDDIVACGGLGHKEGDNCWTVWTYISPLIEGHEMLLHKIALSIMAEMIPQLNGLPIVTVIDENIERNVRWGKRFGFVRVGDAQFNRPIPEGRKFGAYYLDTKGLCNA
jgi:hypothetical protein